MRFFSIFWLVFALPVKLCSVRPSFFCRDCPLPRNQVSSNRWSVVPLEVGYTEPICTCFAAHFSSKCLFKDLWIWTKALQHILFTVQEWLSFSLSIPVAWNTIGLSSLYLVIWHVLACLCAFFCLPFSCLENHSLIKIARNIYWMTLQPCVFGVINCVVFHIILVIIDFFERNGVS